MRRHSPKCAKTLTARLGKVTVERTCRRRADCGKGLCPPGAWLEPKGRSMTPGAGRTVVAAEAGGHCRPNRHRMRRGECRRRGLPRGSGTIGGSRGTVVAERAGKCGSRLSANGANGIDPLLPDGQLDSGLPAMACGGLILPIWAPPIKRASGAH